MKFVKIFILLALIFPSLGLAFESDLKYGSSGPEVAELQEFLTDKGFYSGPITGSFYSLTRSAVIKFQGAYNITPMYGYFGPMTRGKANEILQVFNSNEQKQEIQEQGRVSDPFQYNPINDLQDQLDALLLQVQLQTEQIKNQKQQETNNTNKYTEIVIPKKSVLDIVVQNRHYNRGDNFLIPFQVRLYNRGNKTITISGGTFSAHNASSTLNSIYSIEGMGSYNYENFESSMKFDKDIMIPASDGSYRLIEFMVSLNKNYMNNGEIIYITLDSLRTDADEIINSFPVKGPTYEI